MEEKRAVYEVFTSIWSIAKEYVDKEMTDDEWDLLIKKMSKCVSEQPNKKLQTMAAKIGNAFAEYKEGKHYD